MQRLARSKQCSRTGSLNARKRRSRVPRTGHLANPASLIGIPRLEAAHAGSRIAFGCSDLTALAQTLVEIGLATQPDWIAVGKTPAALVDSVFRRCLRDHGQEIITEHFELSLTLGESIVDTSYSDSGADSNGQLFLVLNTESSFPLGIGTVIEELDRCHPGLGVAFYETLRQALYRWVRVYDDWDARNRIEQMVEWGEGEEDPDSYRQTQTGIVLHAEVEGLFLFPAAPPFEKAVGRKQAPTAHKGIPERRLTRHRLRARIDRLKADSGVCGPGRNQAPAS
jgi:hypothetical protein